LYYVKGKSHRRKRRVHTSLAYADSADFDGEALRRQDATEFRRLYEAFAPELGRYLARLCGDADAAQDLLQETFVKAYSALPRTRPGLAPRPWLYKIATNTARSAARMASWKRVFTFGGHPPDLPEPVFAGFDSLYAEADLVERALAAIKPDYASPLLLHWREGFDIDELCAILGLSRDNLKKRLYRAKKAFAVAYARECARSEDAEGGIR
jgi:RNA polymerase sigma-70 factor (ECF subfamily)